MSLYAIGDLHLSLSSDKPMDVFGGGWSNYVAKIKDGFSRLGPDDVCVICGDVSWGMSLEESAADFRFLGELPGKKILLKGNHDYWWTTAAKMKAFFLENGAENTEILNNNCYIYGDKAICGTRGWLTDEASDDAHNRKIMAREAMRLEASLKAAESEGATEKLCFFHYPPRFKNLICRELLEVMTAYGVKSCRYGHIHGHAHRYAVEGVVEGVYYEMVSADYLGFVPKKIL